METPDLTPNLRPHQDQGSASSDSSVRSNETTASTPPYSTIIGRPIDNTALSAYTSCPRKFLYGMVLNRRASGQPSPALSYGSGWHVALETSYRAPMMARAELQDYVEDAIIARWQESSNPEDYRTPARCIVEYDKYLTKYGLPWEEEAKTVGWPTHPMVEQSVEMPIPGARHPYTGKLDRIIEVNGQYLIEDHKTASMFRSDYFKQWELDNQMIGYAVLASIVTGLPIAGVRINLHVIRKSDSVFERKTIHFVQDRLEDWKRNYDHWLGRIEGDLARYREPWAGDSGAFPHNFSACSGKYGMCQYAGVCSMPPRLRQRVLETDFEELPWNPLEVEDAE